MQQVLIKIGTVLLVVGAFCPFSHVLASRGETILLIVKGTTRNELTFCVTAQTGTPSVEISSLRVGTWYGGGRQRSGVETLWVVLPANGRASASVAGCIKYGETPPGFGGTTAQPLQPDRYYVAVGLPSGATARAHFTVKRDGLIDIWSGR